MEIFSKEKLQMCYADMYGARPCQAEQRLHESLNRAHTTFFSFLQQFVQVIFRP
jgi:hypothetical protein